MNIYIVTPHIAIHDAVSNDILGQHKAFAQAGHQVKIFAEENDGKIPGGEFATRQELLAAIADPTTCLIYHHSIYWRRGMSLLARARCHVYLRYHNITPPGFYLDFDPFVAKSTYKGRKQTEWIAKQIPLAGCISDSAYNARELAAMGIPAAINHIVPPFHRIDDFTQTPFNEDLRKQLKQNGCLNVLFVGRVVPNKGHRHLIRVVRSYAEQYGDAIKLHIVGHLFPNKPFLTTLEHEVNRHNLGNLVQFHQNTTFRDLHTLYAASDIFLVMSEHEGFCVPILEAQFHGLPVIAWESTAVADTLGPEQLTFKDLNYVLFATALHEVGASQEYRRYLSEQGLLNYARYRLTCIERDWLEVFRRDQIG